MNYHSISAIGVGFGFSVISTTFPLLNRINRSAIGANAELWVIKITVKEGKYRYEESIYEGYPSYFMERKKEIFLHYDDNGFGGNHDDRY